MTMPRKLPPFVERNHVKGRTYFSFRIGKGHRIRLPNDPTSPEFRDAYAAALSGDLNVHRLSWAKKDAQGSIGALITSYMRSAGFVRLRPTSKNGYMRRLESIRVDHGHRSVSKMTRERIVSVLLRPYADRPGAALDLLKKLRILIRHAIDIGWLKSDPSFGIKRPKTKVIRAWTDAELASFERRWPSGTKQRTAYALMLNVGTARVDVHRMTWAQIDAAPREHVTILNTEFGKPFTINGFSGFMRHAIKRAGLPMDCKPHGLRKTLGRRLADAGVSAHDIMAALGHTTLAEAENYTREADRRRGGRRAVLQLNDHNANTSSQTGPEGLGRDVKRGKKST
jgi:enterobacteria phage integrase